MDRCTQSVYKGDVVSEEGREEMQQDTKVSFGD